MPPGGDDVVRRLLDHWERGEFAPKLDHLHPDVVLVNRVSGRGFEGLDAFANCIDEAYAEAGVERP